MEDKTEYQAGLLANRLCKNYKKLRKWARKNGICSYRLYDRDIPEVPLALDLYTFLPENISDRTKAAAHLAQTNALISANGPDGQAALQDELQRSYIHLSLYERPDEKAEEEEKRWLQAMALAAAQSIGIDKDRVIIKTRKKLSGTAYGRLEQYEKIQTEQHITGIVPEQGLLFLVNLTDYLDTGLFLDHRPLRKQLFASCKDKAVLNLFCYTGSFSVYAAAGGASRVDSIDLSNTYLDWAKSNFRLNSLEPSSKRYQFIREDAVSFLCQNAESGRGQKYDIIILDPPTFSNSKNTSTTLDIKRDWQKLIADSLALLNPQGTLYFSTNSKSLKFDEKAIQPSSRYSIEALKDTVPEDYRNEKIHRAWKIKSLAG